MNAKLGILTATILSLVVLATASWGPAETKAATPLKLPSAERWEYGELAQFYWKQKGYSYYWETGKETVDGNGYESLLKQIDGSQGDTSTDVLNALGKQGWVLVNFDRSIDGYYGSALIWTLKRKVP